MRFATLVAILALTMLASSAGAQPRRRRLARVQPERRSCLELGDRVRLRVRGRLRGLPRRPEAGGAGLLDRDGRQPGLRRVPVHH